MKIDDRSATTRGPAQEKEAQLLLAQYGELWLKGKNRGSFEEALMRNIRAAIEPVTPVKITRGHGHLVIRPERRFGEATRRLADVFGISSLAPARRSDRGLDSIAEVAREVLEDALRKRPADEVIRFRIRTKRADKRYPHTSTEVDVHIAEEILEPYEERLKIDLRSPELTLGIRIQAESAYVHAERIPGLGGLPVGTLGKALCLLSGGIDSPVAAWLTMKRGCRVSFVTFHSYPYLGEGSKEKVLGLARELMRYQPRAFFYSVPFTEIQTAIRDLCAEKYRTVLYRRMMQRIACRLARMERSQALITGESLGQVASQTLENMISIEAAADLPVLRPLVAFDKQETIELAHRIGTFERSIQPEPDCCTVFQPKRPIIRSRPELCEAEESHLDVEDLVARALAGTERTRLPDD